MVREQKRTRAISVGERPSEASSTMCILSLLLGRRSRFIFWMRSLRSCGAMVILCMDGRLFGGWHGFGVFTMPQGTAVCSIILCIYLAARTNRF